MANVNRSSERQISISYALAHSRKQIDFNQHTLTHKYTTDEIWTHTNTHTVDIMMERDHTHVDFVVESLRRSSSIGTGEEKQNSTPKVTLTKQRKSIWIHKHSPAKRMINGLYMYKSWLCVWCGQCWWLANANYLTVLLVLCA